MFFMWTILLQNAKCHRSGIEFLILKEKRKLSWNYCYKSTKFARFLIIR